MASATPAQSIRAGRSPRTSPTPIIVAWTAPKSRRAPTAAPISVYARVNATA